MKWPDFPTVRKTTAKTKNQQRFLTWIMHHNHYRGRNSSYRVDTSIVPLQKLWEVSLAINQWCPLLLLYLENCPFCSHYYSAVADSRTMCIHYLCIQQTPIVQQLYRLLTCCQAQCKTLVLSFKVLPDLGPEYLKDHLFPWVPCRKQRLQKEVFLTVPLMKEACLEGMQERTFSVIIEQPPQEPLTVSLQEGLHLSASVFIYWQS